MGIFEASEAEGAESIIMGLYFPHRYPKYFESVTLIQPQHKAGEFKGQQRVNHPKQTFA